MYRLWRTCTSRVGAVEPLLKSFDSGISSASVPYIKSPAVTFKSRKVSKYGGRFTVAMFPGDGIGPEMMGYVKEMFRYGGVPVDFEVIEMDSRSDNYEDLDNAITAVKRNGVAIKGNIETRLNRPHVKSRNVEMRTQLDLYANVIPCKSYSGINSRHKGIDLIIIRQNTEGEYLMLEHESNSGIVESLKIITRDCSRKVAKFAFDYAVKYDRKKVTIVHKANIMKLSDGLFLETCLEIAKEYPQIEHESMIIDNCCMQLVSRPQQFDVMLMPNLYGTVVSNVACGLVGGPGLSSGRNYGDKYAVFETGTRNTGSGIVGRNIANPCAMINASADLLDYLGLKKHSQVIRDAVQRTISVDNLRTPDLGGQSTTSEVAQNIIKIVHETTKDLSWFHSEDSNPYIILP